MRDIERTIADSFRDYSPLAVEVPMDRASGRLRPFCFITCRTETDAQRAIDEAGARNGAQQTVTGPTGGGGTEQCRT